MHQVNFLTCAAKIIVTSDRHTHHGAKGTVANMQHDIERGRGYFQESRRHFRNHDFLAHTPAFLNASLATSHLYWTTLDLMLLPLFPKQGRGFPSLQIWLFHIRTSTDTHTHTKKEKHDNLLLMITLGCNSSSLQLSSINLPSTWKKDCATGLQWRC